MKYGVYCIRDLKAATFGSVFLSLNNSTAEREFLEAMKRNIFAQDMELYHIATFDSERGTILSVEPSFVVAYASLVREEE